MHFHQRIAYGPTGKTWCVLNVNALGRAARLNSLNGRICRNFRWVVNNSGAFKTQLDVNCRIAIGIPVLQRLYRLNYRSMRSEIARLR